MILFHQHLMGQRAQKRDCFWVPHLCKTRTGAGRPPHAFLPPHIRSLLTLAAFAISSWISANSHARNCIGQVMLRQPEKSMETESGIWKAQRLLEIHAGGDWHQDHHRAGGRDQGAILLQRFCQTRKTQIFLWAEMNDRSQETR